MTQTIKIAVPMAGFGSRMRPHTWSKAKPLIALAGKTVLDHVLDQFRSLPSSFTPEYIFIVGPNQLAQVQAHMQEHHSDKVVQYVIQEEMRGQSDALHLAAEYLRGPMLMSFSDTLIETDLSILEETDADGIAWVKPVEDPRRFGVADTDEEGNILRLIEKPEDIRINKVVVGYYYFASGERLIEAIEEQKQRGMTLKNEYFLADAVNVMLEHGARFRTQLVDVWLDAGIPDAVLETNRYLLEHRDYPQPEPRPGVVFVPPVAVDPSAELERCVIGPHVSVGAGCCLSGCVVSDSILAENVQAQDLVLSAALIGRDVRLTGRPRQLNVGDNSVVGE